MRDNPDYRLDDTDRIRSLVEDNPWATLVSAAADGLVASHLPVLVEPGQELTVVGHLGRPDDELHELGSHEAMLVVEGSNGYVSPDWYGQEPAVPTWNYLAVHLYGRPELLDAEASMRVLSDTVDRFERVRETPYRLDVDAAYVQGLARGVASFRLRPTRMVAKARLSQDKAAEVVDRVVHALDTDPHYRNPELATEMRRNRSGAGAASW